MSAGECRRCLLREASREDVFRSVTECIEKLPPADRVDDGVYAQRLEACASCDHLISGVCMKCGCYVEFRAAVRKMKCPDAAGRKW